MLGINVDVVSSLKFSSGHIINYSDINWCVFVVTYQLARYSSQILVSCFSLFDHVTLNLLDKITRAETTNQFVDYSREMES